MHTSPVRLYLSDSPTVSFVRIHEVLYLVSKNDRSLLKKSPINSSLILDTLHQKVEKAELVDE
jgi:hypothetical protein